MNSVSDKAIQVALEAAKVAGAIQKEWLGKVLNISYKGEINPVTEVDKLCEENIIKIIRREFPYDPILAEEGVITSATSSNPSSPLSEFSPSYQWIIDPLDGTVNYSHGVPIFCISIAIADINQRDDILFGVVYNPMLDELFTAKKGAGAYLNENPIKVSKTAELSKSLLATGFPYDIKTNPQNAVTHFINFLLSAQAIRRAGAASLDLAYVAMGRFDGFWEEKLFAWDVAAGVLLVKEAGGMVSDFSGNPIDIYKPKETLASNGLIHNAMIEILQRGKNLNY